MDKAQVFAALVKAARRVLVFTGAGISTGSGIPDFRGPQGLWKRREPVYIQDFLSSEDKRAEYWDYKLEGYQSFRHAQPNAAHRALAEFEKLGFLELLVTQNIDGLHHKAGVSDGRIIELHGSNRLVGCLTCGQTQDPSGPMEEFERTRRCPVCPCGGFLKPTTISFGQALPTELLERSFAAAEVADLVISLGSTLQVEPAASVPARAARRGVPYVVVNQGPTGHEQLATLRLSDDLCELLPQVVAAL